MLALPAEWQSITGGAVVTHLLGQVHENALRQEMARHLIGACLDLAAAGIALRTQTPPVPKLLSNLYWQIGDYTFVYLHDMNDASLARAVEIGSRFVHGNIIVPPRHEEILWRACQSIMGNRTPSIIALDSLVNLRTLFTSADFRWPYERAVLAILHRYNRRTLDAMANDAVMVAVPSDCAWPP